MTENENSSAYQPGAIAQHFDTFATQEWERLTRTPVDEVNLYIHTHYLTKHIRPGSRVLEIGAGAGRFTQLLAQLGARVVVADISAVQLELNQRFAQELGFAPAVEDWRQVDICDLAQFAAGSFDAVVAYGGPFSYVLDKRDQALHECQRVLRPGGMLLLSVMSLWGTAHAFLPGVLALPAAINQKITATGDLTPATNPQRQGHYMHMFRAAELLAWLAQHNWTVVDRSAANCLSPTWKEALALIRGDPEKWPELLRIELEASAEEGCLNMGTHIIAVAEK
jgi:2-polyprenyl-3-methyl-5-hydroxy-6-metoxy-1,4-benzoquinol methylase